MYLTNVIKKIYTMLNKRSQNLMLFVILPVSILNAIFNMASIGSIMPFMAMVVQPDLITTNPKLNWLFTHLHFSSVKLFIIAGGLCSLGMLICANFFTIFSIYVYKKFIARVFREIGQKLLLNYLSKDYSYFLNVSSSLLSKNIITDVNVLIYYAISPLISIITQISLIVLILLFLMFVNVVMTTSIIVILSGIYSALYFLQSKWVRRLSHKTEETDKLRHKEIYEVFGGIKLIKLCGMEEIYLKRFLEHNREYIRANSMVSFLSEYPKSILEAVAIGGALLTIVYLYAATNHPGEIIGYISIFVFSGYRLMPSIQTIYKDLTNIQGQVKLLDGLYPEIISEPQPTVHANNKEINFSREILLKNITFAYKDTGIPFPKKINLTIKHNTTIGFVGTTGAGKSTLVDIIMGLLKSQSGMILIDDEPLDETNIRSWQNHFGYVQQQIFLTDDTIEKNIAFGIKEDEIDQIKLESAVKLASLDEFIDQLPLGYKTLVGERGVRLSGGQLQRLGIARALYNKPQILVFDEATSSLDGITEQAIIEAIAKLVRQKTMIIIAHRLTTVKDCDVIYMLEKGQIVDQGNFEQLMHQNEQFKKMAKAVKM